MAPTPSPLAGLTVLEFPHSVALRHTGRLLAALGARVLQAGTPEREAIGWGGAAGAAFAAWLDAGKQPFADADAALAVAGDEIDLLLAGPDAAGVQQADALARRLAAQGRPPLRLALTWFDLAGPYRGWAGSDALIQALSGVAFATGPADGLPLLPRGHAPQAVAGVTAAIAALAALLGRRRGWTGQTVELDVLAANLCFQESTACAAGVDGARSQRRGINRFTPTYPGGIWRSADGWIGITALTPPQWQAFCRLAGLPDDVARHPRYQVAQQRLDDADALDALIAPAIARQTSAHWLERGQALRIPFAPVPTLAALPQTPHWQQRGSFAPVPGVAGAVGPTLPFRFGQAGDPAPGLPAHPGGEAGPLAGLRILDLSMGWAGPLCTRHLADLGADVVKVESCSHVDWWRGFDAPDAGDPPPYEIRPGFLMVNRHKRGITLDLKAPRGVALLQALAARSDAMVENYAPGVLDKLGIGTTAMAAAVPGLVAMAMGAFGQTGPWAAFRAYGSTVEQACGLPFVNGEPGDPPTMQHVAYGDPVAGLYGAVAVLAGLHGRAAGQGGATVDLCQVECLFQLGADALVAQSLQAAPLAREGSRHPLSALRCVLAGRPSAAPDAPPPWIAVDVQSAAQWRALAALLGLADDTPADAPVAALQAQEPGIAAALAAWAAARPPADAVAALQRAGVPAAAVQAGSDLMHDAQAAAAGSFQWLERPHAGRHPVTRSPQRIDGRPLPLGDPAPTLGQANADVLGGLLGLPADELAALDAAGITGRQPVWPG